MLNRIGHFFCAPSTSLFFIGLMFCLPFTVAYHHLPIAAFYGEWLSATLGLLAMLALLGKTFWQSVKIPQLALVFLGLAAIAIMQAILGMTHSPQYALLVLSYIAWAFVLVVLGSYLRRKLGWEKLATTLAWFVVLGGVVNVGFVALQIAMKCGVAIAWMPKLSSYGALAQRNNFADFIGLATASLMYLYAKKQLKSAPFWLGLVLFISLLAFSGSRSVWLYLATLTGLAIALQTLAIKQGTGTPQKRSLLRVALSLLPLFILLQLLLHYTLPDNLIDLPGERLSASLEDNTASLRGQFWQTSWYLFTQNLWLGIGAGQMRWQTFMLLDSPNLNPAKMVFEHSHNVFIHLLTEMGAGAGLLAVVGLVAWLRAFNWRELSLETWWLVALLAIIGIHSSLEYPLWYTYFLGVFAFLLGAGEEKLSQFNLAKIRQTAARVIANMLVLIAVVNLATMLIAYQKLEHWMDRAIDKQVADTRVNPKAFFESYLWIRQNTLLSPYAEWMYLNAMTPEKIQLNDLVRMSESTIRFMPTQNLVFQHALLLKLKGNQAEAVKQLNRALVAYPNGLKSTIARQPLKYKQEYLDLLSISHAIASKNTPKKDQKTEAKK